MKAPIYSREGKKKGEVVLNPEIYDVYVNDRLLQLAHKAYAANLRRGTASTKVRKEVRGGGKKPWRQKGTGRARASSIRSPIWKGGGVTFGPHPRDYSVHMSKNMRLSALVSALSLRAGEKKVVVLNNAALESPKTREFVEIVKSLPNSEKRALYVVKNIEENLSRASRNVRDLVQVKKVSDVSAYQVLQRERLIIDEEALPAIEERLLPAVKKDKKADAKTEKTQKAKKKAE